jgi:hypothetical protein
MPEWDVKKPVKLWVRIAAQRLVAFTSKHAATFIAMGSTIIALVLVI